MTTATESPEWRLFADWCVATGQTALPTTPATISAFLAAVGGRPSTKQRRVRAIRRAHINATQPLHLPDPEQQRPWRHGDHWLSLPDALAATPTIGWTAGLHGRRDAFLLVLASLGLTRGQIQHTVCADIAHTDTLTVAGHDVVVDGQAASCPACAVTRWLRIAAHIRLGGRADAQQTLLTATDPHISGTHDCAAPLPGDWDRTEQLIPAIDRRGWPDLYRPLSRRAVSAIVAARQGQPVPPVTTTSPPADRTASPHSDLDMDDLLDLLDEATSAADEALRRSENALIDSHTLLDSVADSAPYT